MTDGKKNALLVLTTVAGERQAEEMAEVLVAEGLAACVSYGPVSSVYKWQGRLEKQKEQQLLIKTLAERWRALCARVAELSAYETPELVAVEPFRVEKRYLDWIAAQAP